MSSVLSNPVDCRKRALRKLGELPPFSPILNKLIASLAADDVSFGELAELIEKDTVLAGNVLRMVNSALYGRRGTISSVRHAVSLMGLVRLRNSVMSLSVSRLWSQVKMPRAWPAAQFNRHGAASAVMADLLAQKNPSIRYPEGAFVAGLLHDLGLLLLATAYTQEFDELLRLHGESMPILEAEREVFGLDHADITAAALHEWNLPEPIQRAVRYQFEPERPVRDAIPLSRVLHATECAVNHLEFTALGGEPTATEPALEALEGIGIGMAPEALLDEFNQEFAPMKSFF